MEDALSTIGSHGVLGAIVVVLLFALWRLHNQNQSIQAARVDDAKKVATTLLDVNDKWHTQIQSLTEVVKQLRDQLNRRQ